jgi:soluble lytic murein transglycosylase
MAFPLAIAPAGQAQTGQNPPAALLSSFDQNLFSQVLSALKAQQWTEAESLAGRIGDGTARSLALWLYYQATPQPALPDMMSFVESHADWPRMSKLRWKTEQAMKDAVVSPQRLREWFSALEPLSGMGKLLYGETLMAAGEPTKGQQFIARAWVEHDFPREDEDAILAKHGALLDEKLHRTRLDRQLWERNTSDALRTERLLGAEDRLVSEARRKLINDAADVDAAVGRVPAALAETPGLLFERIRWYRKKGRYEDAETLLLAVTPSAGMIKPEEWWVERNVLARKALEERDYASAYQIAASHGLEQGGGFAEGEWLAGWIALRFLDEPLTALEHFERLYAGVSYPISNARGAYWAGRAALAAKRPVQAGQMFEVARQYPTTFYGQLAAQSVDPAASLSLAPDPAIDDAARRHFDGRPLVRALQLALAFDLTEEAITLIFHLSDRLDNAAELALLAKLAQQADLPHMGVRTGKTAAQRYLDITTQAYPLPAAAISVQNRTSLEFALVLSLSRQESEFNPKALSHAGARGFMQLMPGTARAVAKRHGVSYRGDSGLDDPQYNMELAMHHLDDLLVEFGGSYILAAAAYNAGAQRVWQWMGEFGDPRESHIDPLDWIERIPFNETRNYVQRVLENVTVYRARLAGKAVPVRLAQDIARGGAQRNGLHPTHQNVDGTSIAKTRITVSPDAQNAAAAASDATGKNSAANGPAY